VRQPESNIQNGGLVTSESFAFGSFRLLPMERTLLDNGKPLRLGSRALEILIMLVESAGKIVRKDELIAHVWPGTTVDEASLRVQVAALRKTLGDGRDGNRFITNVPGRGYAFVGPARRVADEPPQKPPLTAGRGNDIPVFLSRIVGRADITAALAEQLARRRLLTIVGPGGIGKTTVAAAIAEAARASFPDGVWFVGLASLPSPELVPSAVGAVLDIPLPAANPLAGLAAWLRDKHALVVLDNCEHVVEAVASLTAEILRTAPHVSILATSREPLRTDAEWRHRLAPLEYPREAAGLSVDKVLQYSAVQLFNERASAVADDFVIGENIPAVVEICRKLDGVPLALELAAAHVDVLSVQELAARLDNRFALLIQGRRTALPRHQTLRATLDWSYGLLPEAEQVILRRLSVFRGDFTMDAAVAVAADAQLTRAHVVNAIANLVDKSLLAADIGGDVTWYRLLELTRVYASHKLQESGEYERVMHLLAGHMRDVFAGSEAGAVERSRNEWFAHYGRQVDNLRAALEWAFSGNGDARLGVALAVGAVNFWIAMALLNECCDWGLKAVAQLGAAEGTREEMMLQCGLGQALIYSRGMQPAARVALARALTVAEALADIHYQLRVLYALWLYAIRVCDLRQCMSLAANSENLISSAGDSAASALSDFVYGLTRYYLAEHSTATANLQRMLAQLPALEACRGSRSYRCRPANLRSFLSGSGALVTGVHRKGSRGRR
jgi:predicted ATPase/DNA-binding winged helix-turn-helix (wHTH) protein